MVVGVPNDCHCSITLDAAKAGKHVVMEKPPCLNLAEADQMIDACRKAEVKLMYAEELCFTPPIHAAPPLSKALLLKAVYKAVSLTGTKSVTLVPSPRTL
jgi:predicted dehydrogenase